MDWIKEILEKHIGEDGTLDMASAIDEVKVEFPKNAITKEVFNQKNEDLKAANLLVADLKKDNADVTELQTKIDEYEKEVETLNKGRLEDKKTYTLKEKLKDAGAKDIDYLIYKLGEVESDSEGNIVNLDSKLKDLQTEYATQFEAQEEPTQDVDNKGYVVVDNGLDDGAEPNQDAILQQQVEEAMGLQQE